MSNSPNMSIPIFQRKDSQGNIHYHFVDWNVLNNLPPDGTKQDDLLKGVLLAVQYVAHQGHERLLRQERCLADLWTLCRSDCGWTEVEEIIRRHGCQPAEDKARKAGVDVRITREEQLDGD